MVAADNKQLRMALKSVFGNHHAHAPPRQARAARRLEGRAAGRGARAACSGQHTAHAAHGPGWRCCKHSGRLSRRAPHVFLPLPVPTLCSTLRAASKQTAGRQAQRGAAHPAATLHQVQRLVLLSLFRYMGSSPLYRAPREADEKPPATVPPGNRKPGCTWGAGARGRGRGRGCGWRRGVPATAVQKRAQASPLASCAASAGRIVGSAHPCRAHPRPPLRHSQSAARHAGSRKTT